MLGSMRCLWLKDGQLTLRRDVPEPTVGTGEALVAVRLAGVCATDLELRRGYSSFTGIPGHELVGEVLEAPDAPRWVGRRVVSEINAACGECPTCAAGRPTHCPRRTVVGIVGRAGCFAERVTLPVANLHEVPGSMADEVAVFTEPLAAALEIGDQVPIRPSDRVLLIGAGRLGQLIARVLALVGCELLVVARRSETRELLAVAGVEAITEDELSDSGRFDVVIEASGAPEGFALARRAVRPRGTLVLKSTYAGRLEVDASALVVDEVTVVGSRCGPFAPALRLLERGFVDPRPLIEARYGLDRGLEAFERAGRPGGLKVLIAPGGERTDGR